MSHIALTQPTGIRLHLLRLIQHDPSGSALKSSPAVLHLDDCKNARWALPVSLAIVVPWAFPNLHLRRHPDKIRNLLEDMPVEDESMESKVRKNIGYIGELIYEQYLKNAKIKYDYAAARGVGDYDFSLDAVDSRPKTYVDVKTNLYSFKEEAVPFYIHKSQNRFMQEHPEEPFRIVRISLTDLDLNKSYERMRDLYGPETDYEASEELREYCQKIARDYWRKARIEEFDAASPEYGIKIERLPR